MANEQILALVDAIKSNNIRYIANLLSEDHLSWRTTIVEGTLPAIHLASMCGQLEIVQLMLKKDASLLNLTDEYNQTPILFAATYGHEDLVDYLAKFGADLNIATNASENENHGRAPIHWAVKNEHPTIALCLIKHGADITALLGEDKLHVIHIAASHGHLDLVNVLLDINPIWLNLPNAKNQTPVSLAITNGHLPVVEYLVERGADLKIAINAPMEPYDEFLPIHCAIGYGQLTIFRYLIQVDSDTDILLGSMQYHLIHLASKQGELEIVKILLDKTPGCLEYKDDFNQTPILLAVANDHGEIVKYLISKGANLNVISLDPRNKRNEKTLLMWAMDECLYSVANVLILQLTEGQDKTTILPYITNGLQALELMKQDPSLIKMLLADKLILELIAKDNSCHTSEQTISWYDKRSDRRSSFFACINKQHETSSVFKPSKYLGVGTFGIVRLFTNEQGENIAVKAPIEMHVNINKSAIEKLHNATALEAKLNSLAYPYDKSPELFDFCSTRSGDDIYDNRYVMSFVEGAQPDIFMSEIMDEYELARVVFEMALELQRIHQVGILHGDIFQKNILIHRVDNKYHVRFIDFGLSLLLTAPRIRTWIPVNGNCKWYPPEQCGTTRVTDLKPHTSQDVYSLGFLLNQLLLSHCCYQQVMQSFPSIQAFITESQKIAPLERPALASFCEQLKNELNSNEILSDISTSVCKI